MIYMTPTILQINTVVNSGSVGRIAEQIGQKIKAEGWNSWIAYGRGNQPSESELLKIGSIRDVYLHGIRSRLSDNHGLSSMSATRNFIDQVKVLKPDLVHLHNIHGYYLHYPLLFNYLSTTNIPIVWTLHDCWPFTGHCTHFSVISCNKWERECYCCEQLRTYPISLLADRSARNYHDKKQAFTSVSQMTLVPVSQWMSNLVKRSFLGNYSVQTIYNGVDTTIFTPTDSRRIVSEQYEIAANQFLILGVANVWTPHKGLNDFIALRKILPPTCHLLLVGLSSKQISRLPEGITGVAHTENVQQLADLYAAADLFINPTWEDNFPTTNLEALASGTPVATYRTGGSIEAVNEATGFIVEQGDISGLLSVICTVQTKGKVSYTAACRQRALTRFDKQDRYIEYIQLYKKLLNQEIK